MLSTTRVSSKQLLRTDMFADSPDLGKILHISLGNTKN